MESKNISLANNIISSRKKLGLSQEALAEKANVSLSTIQRIEKGTVKPRVFTLKVLAESLEIEASELLSHLEVKDDIPHDIFLILKKINLYALFIVFIPFINLVIPLIVWKKSKQLSSQNNIAGKIISFQLLWSICTIIGAFISIFLTNLITGEAGSGHYVANTFYLTAVIFNVYIIVKTASQLNKKEKKVLMFIPNLF